MGSEQHRRPSVSPIPLLVKVGPIWDNRFRRLSLTGMDFIGRISGRASGWRLWGVVLAVVLAGIFSGRADAATFDVNTLGDPGTGVCDVTECTLREAITAANGDGEQSTINFSVSGDIAVNSALPNISTPLTMDGTTAPGWAPDAPSVGISGVSVPSATALKVYAQLTFRGIRIAWFKQGVGLYLYPGAAGSIVESSTFGQTGTGGVVNRYGLINQANNVMIGGYTAAKRNIFIGSNNNEIELRLGTGAKIVGNYIGNTGVAEVNPAFTGTGIGVQSAPSNTVIENNVISGNQHGLSLSTGNPIEVTDNLIGTTPDGSGPIPNLNGINLNLAPPGFVMEGNTVAFNQQQGISVSSQVTGVDLTATHIHSNQRLGIDLEPDGTGVTPNDPLDADTGANDRQNFPEISSARMGDTETAIEGILESTPETEFRVGFYANPACNPRGYGEGKYLLGEVQVLTDENGSAHFDLDVDPLPPGAEYVSTLATNPGGSTSEFGPCVQALDAENPADPDYRVTNLNTGGAGSLREAINEANRDPDLNTITFEVAGDLGPVSPLPTVVNPVTIDGLSAPGASPGTPVVSLANNRYLSSPALVLASPSTIQGIAFSTYDYQAAHVGTAIRIEPEADDSIIRNSWLGNPYSPAHGNGIGVHVLADRVLIENNLISSNKIAGVLLEGHDAKIKLNKIGTNLDGRSAMANGTGIRVLAPAAGGEITNNQIAGNSGNGIFATGASGLAIQQNRIGLYSTGVPLIPNGTGIRLVDSANSSLELNQVYGNTGDGLKLENSQGITSSDDLIARNGGDGVEITGNQSEGADFSRSSIHTNTGLGIDLGGDGVTGNDPGDGDSGPNGLQNSPYIDAAVFDKNQVEVTGLLDSTPGQTFRIRIFANSECDVPGFGEGEISLGEVSVTSAGNGEAPVQAVVAPIPLGKGKISAVAVSPDGSVSEFGNCITATPAPPSFEVKSLADNGDGICDSTCTLRDAIIGSNQNPEPKTITFKVAGTISLSSGLPSLSTPVTIDGTSAPGATAGSPTVELSGFNLTPVPGLNLAGPVTVQGLKLTGFTQAPAVRVTGNAAGTVLRGNQIGDSSGIVPRNQIGISVSSGGVTIGGTTPGDANVIVGSLTDNVLVTGGSQIAILGNYIGTDPSNPAHQASGQSGIRLTGPVPDMRIGGPEAGAGNVIAGILGWGIRMTGAAGVSMENNKIGMRADRSPLGNGEGGMLLESGTSGVESKADAIAFNNGPGIRVEGTSTANDFAEASIHSNAGLGIDLRADGVSANDPLDADTGPNGMQNFPVLKSAQASGAGIRVEGEIDLPAAGGVAIDFYASSACDPSGHGEGKVFLGTLPRYFEQAGVNQFVLDLPLDDSSLRQITATATGVDGTSEFSACFAASGFDPITTIEAPKRVRAIAVNGKTFIAEPEDGRIVVTFPGGSRQVLDGETEIPVGSTINASGGRVELTSANPGDQVFQSARFWAGTFKVSQKRGETLVLLSLTGGLKRNQVCKRGKPRSKLVLRRLWGSGKGRFKTKGNKGAAGVRGTIWLSADRCDGSLFSVREGVVEVRDFVKKSTVILRRGESYLARNASASRTKSRRGR